VARARVRIGVVGVVCVFGFVLGNARPSTALVPLEVSKAFTSRPQGVLVVADGRRLRALNVGERRRPSVFTFKTLREGVVLNPSYAPSIRRIVYEETSTPGKSKIRVFPHLDGFREISGADPAVSRPGKRLAYVVPDGLEVADLDRAGSAHRITNGLSDEDPAWGRSGLIAFVRATPGRQRALYAVRSDGTGLRRLFQSSLSVNIAQWSPNGRSLLLSIGARDRVDCEDVRRRVRVLGKPPRFAVQGVKGYLVTGRRCKFARITWSPDGGFIAFTDGPDIRIITRRGKRVVAYANAARWARRGMTWVNSGLISRPRGSARHRVDVSGSVKSPDLRLPPTDVAQTSQFCWWNHKKHCETY
jgi:hypothetical protein